MFLKNKHLSYLFRAFSIFSSSPCPADLVFFVTPHCHCHCEYCLYKKFLNDPERSQQILTLKEVHKIASNYQRPVVKLSLSGGEPFLREDLVEIIEEFVLHTDTKIIDIPTNASIPGVIADKVQKILARNPEVILEIQLSLDGTKEIHERIRGVPGLFDCVLQTYAELDRLRQKNRQLKIKMNVLYLPDNHDNILKLFAWLLERNYLFNRFQVVFPHGAPIEEVINNTLNFAEFYRISQYVLKEYPFYDKNDFHSLLFRAIKIERDNVLLKTIRTKSMGEICKAGKRNLVLDDIGNVFPCEPMWQSIGNIRDYEYSMEKICRSESFAEFKKQYWGNKKCNCTGGNIALDEVIYNPLYYPKVIYNLIKLYIHYNKSP